MVHQVKYKRNKVFFSKKLSKKKCKEATISSRMHKRMILHLNYIGKQQFDFQVVNLEKFIHPMNS